MKYIKRQGEEPESQSAVVYSEHNHFMRPRCTAGEISLGESKVSVGGYIDSLELIGQLLNAGENLQALRVAMSGAAYDYDVYDNSIADEDISLPVSRNMAFDLVDLTNLKRDIDGKIKLFQESNGQDTGVKTASVTSDEAVKPIPPKAESHGET